MAYENAVIFGETTSQVDEDGRYLDVKTSDGLVVLHVEDDEGYTEITLDVAETLALIRSLTDAIADVV